MTVEFLLDTCISYFERSHTRLHAAAFDSANQQRKRREGEIDPDTLASAQPITRGADSAPCSPKTSFGHDGINAKCLPIESLLACAGPGVDALFGMET